jgi:hypothetical protein
MSKFLRVIESSLPSGDQTNHTLTSNSVLMDITDSIRSLNLKYFIKPNRPSKPPMSGDVKESGIVYVNDAPKFKITITPIKDEEGEDAEVISAAAQIADPAIRRRAQPAANDLINTAITSFGAAGAALKNAQRRI